MNDYNNESLKLKQYTSNLHTKTGQFNLYICLCHRECKPNIDRLKTEVERIRQLVLKIENEIDNLSGSR